MKSIKISVFHSHKGGKLFWKHLNDNWKKYGNREITISLKYLSKEITLKRLYKENPDILIFSDTAGSLSEFTMNEINALREYFRKERCKHLIGTYALFEHTVDDKHYDNRKICQFFGLNESENYITKHFHSSQEETKKNIIYYPTNAQSQLWNNISIPYESYGYNHTQTIKTNHWFDSFNNFISERNTFLLANNKEKNAIISYHQTEWYSSLYISSMIEYNDLQNETDCQFMYNVFLFLIGTRPLLSFQSYLIHEIKYLSQKKRKFKKYFKKKMKTSLLPSQIEILFHYFCFVCFNLIVMNVIYSENVKE